MFASAAPAIETKVESHDETSPSPKSLKTISEVAVKYHLVQSQKEIDELIGLLEKVSTICFDTETTNIDANLAELVGLAFAIEPGEA
ncbi:MAG: hypothetical protein MUE71_07055, partial [Chitinophagaceae bacterium]|nr:hypothetical protein [Chitinophagaceae bacterium]